MGYQQALAAAYRGVVAMSKNQALAAAAAVPAMAYRHQALAAWQARMKRLVIAFQMLHERHSAHLRGLARDSLGQSVLA